jgi:hypothetical protein
VQKASRQIHGPSSAWRPSEDVRLDDVNLPVWLDSEGPNGLRNHTKRQIVNAAAATCCVLCPITNRFGVEFQPKDVRWAASQGVGQELLLSCCMSAVLTRRRHCLCDW